MVSFYLIVYCVAVKYYHLALDNINNDIERIKTLGALSQVSKVEGNIELSKGYASKILAMDSKNAFANQILAYKKPQKTYNVAKFSSLPITTKTFSGNKSSCSLRGMACIALTWGPDACSTAFNKLSESSLSLMPWNDVLLSPTCAITISELINEDYSQSDIEVATLTGLLDEIGSAGVDSDNIFANVFGGLSYLYSQSIKVSIFDSCMNKCR